MSGHKRPPQQVLAVAAKKRRLDLNEDCLGVVSKYVGNTRNVLAAISLGKEKEWLSLWLEAVGQDFAQSHKDQRYDTLHLRKCYVPPKTLDSALRSGELGRLAWRAPRRISGIRQLWAKQLPAPAEWIYCDEVMDERFTVTHFEHLKADLYAAGEMDDRVPDGKKVCLWVTSGVQEALLHKFAQERVTAAQQRGRKLEENFNVIEEYNAHLRPLPQCLRGSDGMWPRLTVKWKCLAGMQIQSEGKPFVVFPGEDVRLYNLDMQGDLVCHPHLMYKGRPVIPEGQNVVMRWRITTEYHGTGWGDMHFKDLLRESLERTGLDDCIVAAPEPRYHTLQLSCTW
eukprot:TRINITY_DN55184_c0_g1_i1.p1 TRINITY_DN55184_c0_g1~~TRINITY_DN55184_c0_g1_i1.p1  ORF type:complete len:340 (+),score=98.14 TRINITY_DN55184_c0_g1_i1:83-1102(+)